MPVTRAAEVFGAQGMRMSCMAAVASRSSGPAASLTVYDWVQIGTPVDVYYR